MWVELSEFRHPVINKEGRAIAFFECETAAASFVEMCHAGQDCRVGDHIDTDTTISVQGS